MGLLGKSVPSTVVGLDIGTDFIKVAEAKLAKDGIHITGLGITPTPAGAIDNGMVVDAQALSGAIKQVLRDSGIRSKDVVSIIPGQSAVVVRMIEVPQMTHDELAETMKWEVERHVPFSPSEIIMDFVPIEKPVTSAASQSMEVLLAVAQDSAVYDLVKTLFAAGLQPMAIDVQPLAVSRPLINIAEGNQPQVAAVVNIGASSTDVGIYDNGLLTFPGPPLPIAGVNFTRAISEALGVPVEEAERLKKEFAYADPQIAQNAYGNMGYDADAQQPDPQPATFDTSYQLADPSFHVAGADQTVSDFSPFDFGTAQADPPQPTEEKLDISSEDVFDLGGGQQPTEFKPVFDLDEPDVSPQPAASTFDLGGAEADSATATPDASQPFAQPADLAEPQPTQDDFTQANMPVDNMAKSVADAVTPVLIELATEIRRSLEYYATRYQNRPEQIFLCGGTARLRGLDQFLAIELGIPVQVADPMANVKVNCPKLSPQYLSEVSPFFPVSIGLAIREMLE